MNVLQSLERLALRHLTDYQRPYVPFIGGVEPFAAWCCDGVFPASDSLLAINWIRREFQVAGPAAINVLEVDGSFVTDECSAVIEDISIEAFERLRLPPGDRMMADESGLWIALWLSQECISIVGCAHSHAQSIRAIVGSGDAREDVEACLPVENRRFMNRITPELDKIYVRL